MSRTPSAFSGRWMTGKAIFVGVAALCLLASPARSPAQDAGVSGIAPGPGNVNGLNGSIRIPAASATRPRFPRCRSRRSRRSGRSALTPSAGYRSDSPAYSYRPIHVQRSAKTKRTRYAKKSQGSAAKAHVINKDRRIDHGVVSICRGC